MTNNDTESHNEMLRAVAASLADVAAFAASASQATNNDTESRNEMLRPVAVSLASVAAFATSVNQAHQNSAGAPPTPN